MTAPHGDNKQLVLLSHDELDLRVKRLQALMSAKGVGAMLIADLANLYYLSGRVYSGYIYLPADDAPVFLVKRPVELEGERVKYIRKPEEIVEALQAFNLAVPNRVGLELGLASYSAVERYKKALASTEIEDVTPLIRTARAVKTAVEIEKITISGEHQRRVYERIPGLFHPAMSELELQIEIERLSRLEGCLGQFRISGDSMELFMGNVIAGDNADAPSPYDFAMGGAGIDPSIPVGANGTVLREGMAVMVDVNGNYTGYMSDMTRTFSVGRLREMAMSAHQLSIDIHRRLAAMGAPGTEAKALYEAAVEMVEAAGMLAYFMGHRQHAGFIGHGLGIEINELPVIAPRSRDIIEVGNVIALEPKFVIPHVGAVGIENTYVVTADGWKCVTNAPEEIVDLLS